MMMFRLCRAIASALLLTQLSPAWAQADMSYSADLSAKPEAAAAFGDLTRMIGRWQNGKDEMSVRWTPDNHGVELSFFFSSHQHEIAAGNLRCCDGGKLWFTGGGNRITGFRIDPGNMLIFRTSDGRRMRLTAKGNQMTVLLEADKPPVSGAKRSRAPNDSETQNWYLLRTMKLSRVPATTKAMPKPVEDSRRGLSMWYKPTLESNGLPRIDYQYRYRSTSPKSSLPMFTVTAEPTQYVVAAYGFDKHIAWVARYRRDPKVWSFPLTDVTVSPYARIPVAQGPLEILPSGGWRFGTTAGSRAYALTSSVAGVTAASLIYKDGMGWIDTPQETYIKDAEQRWSGWAGHAAKEMNAEFAAHQRDIRLAALERRQAERDKSRRQERSRALTAQGMASLPSGPPANNPLYTPTPGAPTVPRGMTPKEQAEWSAVEAYKMREQRRVGQAPTTFAEDALAKARSQPKSSSSSTSSTPGRDGDVVETSDAEEARRKAAETARAEQARKDKLAADEAARKKRETDERERLANELLEWKEGVVACEPDKSGNGRAYCHGPLQSLWGSVDLGKPAARVSLGEACGSNPDQIRELGQSSGFILFGCGYGIHPSSNMRSTPMHADPVTRFGINFVDGRRTYRCPRKQTSVCKNYWVG